MHEAERGSFDLHRGRPLLVTGPLGAPAATVVASVEALTPQTLVALRAMSAEGVRLAVGRSQPRRSHESAEVLQATSLAIPILASPPDLRELAAAVNHGSRVAPHAHEASLPEVAGLTLTRRAGHLPSVVSVTVDDPDRGPLGGDVASGAILHVTTEQVEALASSEHPALTEVSTGAVPLGIAENARFVSFREANGSFEHVAVLIGSQEQWPDPVPVRIHSACPAGDLFGSLRCDCGNQLRLGLQAFSANRGGVLLYLGQEGWGSTLESRLRKHSIRRYGQLAECMADSGDITRHRAATEMLRLLGVMQFQLLALRCSPAAEVNGETKTVEARPRRDLGPSRHATHSRDDRPSGLWVDDLLSES